MRIVQVIILGGGDCCGPESQQPRVHEMAVQVPHRTEVKLIAAIVEKHPEVRFAASRTSAHADLYDPWSRPCASAWPTRWRSSAPTSAPRFLSTPVQTSWVWRSRDSSGGGASCPKNKCKRRALLAAQLARSARLFLTRCMAERAQATRAPFLPARPRRGFLGRRRSPGRRCSSPCP